jgi:hypothetical protein
MYHCEQLRVHRDPLDATFDSRQKLLAWSVSSLFVPVPRCGEVIHDL